MKKHYTFSTGETIEADSDDLRRLLAENQRYLDNYEEVYSSFEDDDYIARGNGVCDRKFSDDFIEGQIEKYRARVGEIENWLAESPSRKRMNRASRYSLSSSPEDSSTASLYSSSSFIPSRSFAAVTASSKRSSTSSCSSEGSPGAKL